MLHSREAPGDPQSDCCVTSMTSSSRLCTCLNCLQRMIRLKKRTKRQRSGGKNGKGYEDNISREHVMFSALAVYTSQRQNGRGCLLQYRRWTTCVTNHPPAIADALADTTGAAFSHAILRAETLTSKVIHVIVL
ncbi:hypothetical protein M404DRAFT_950782 [Pisolithus tinctorius Marx 270]|uniref:Uncharacterized protein n=1 Tax=Pisolithus tinctorius Marx 270 TaxID=870435 RepID=A0A0C3P9R8_PISTI|nr:hypothetical protein M404DRAFT_950782 [Pisolithus tinctorius Marx 270]